jgi:predicted GIY-YIG superfamily endonuclease
MAKTTIYVLLCEKNRYYIGKTDRPIENRIVEHFNFNIIASEWTHKYKPIKVVEIKKDADEFDEDKYTKIYMKKYGIDKVRGGTYTQIELPEYQKMTLQNELCSASNLCFRCNRSGHFASNCFVKTKADGSPIEEEESDEEESDDYEEVMYYNKQVCFRCGRQGHYANNCYAFRHANGRKIFT